MEKTTTSIKDELCLDIVDPPADGRDAQKADGIMFFGRRSFSESTWVISLFVVLELVAFVVTMLLNDCPGNSGDKCILRSLGRFSFQPISENPLLGPSSSTLEKMGALQWTLAIQEHHIWRLVTSSWLHAGVAHLIVNLLCVIFVGVRLEQDYGPLRIGVIYLLSAFFGSLVSALFVQHLSAVGSSSALFGLLGAMVSGLISNWQIYDDKVVALVVLAFITITNFLLGLLPYVDNFSNIGGFLAGILLGCVLLFNPQLGQMERKKGIFDFNTKSSVKLKQKLDRPAKRVAALLVFSIMLAGALDAVLHRVNANKHCSWCHYIDCVPTKMWSCAEKAITCEVSKAC